MTKQLFETITKWQDATFPDSTWASKSVHLKMELVELSEAVTAGDQEAIRSELADCFILLAGMAHKLGFSYFDIWQMMHEKHGINLRRKWGIPDANLVVQHVEEGEAQPVPDIDGPVLQAEYGDTKFHYAREVLFTLASCKAIAPHVYLHWVDKINKEELEFRAELQANLPEPPDDDDDTDPEPPFDALDL